MSEYPGYVLKTGNLPHSDTGAHVRYVQRRLLDMGMAAFVEPDPDAPGQFGAHTEAMIRQFQARSVDIDGAPLKIDGMVGPITWAALFGQEPEAQAPSVMLRSVLATAASQVGVLELPAGSNRGPVVDLFLHAVGLDPQAGSYPWCQAFVYWCFQQTARGLGAENPVPKTAGVVAHWRLAGQVPGASCIPSAQALVEPDLVKPGQVFAISVGGGHGHCGFVERTLGGKLVTIEGNTNPGGSREGVGVFRRTSRKIADINLGFVEYTF